MMAPIIEAHGVTKRFGDVRALDGLDLVAESGHVTALLGPNGAGKTTFVSAVATLLRPDGGEIRVAGIDVCADPTRVREVIGLAGQYASVEPAMTGTENLRMVARLFGLSRRDAATAAANVLERLDLGAAGDRLVRTYSGGMRRRLDLGASLVGTPQLLILDEPTTGLDPLVRAAFLDLLRAARHRGATVFLSSHVLDEVDRVADRVGLIANAKLRLVEGMGELRRKWPRQVRVRMKDGSERTFEAPASVPELLEAVRALDPLEIEVVRAGLDDVFRSIVGESRA
jgi:ABC-2 type transport system ATP-binding protein